MPGKMTRSAMATSQTEERPYVVLIERLAAGDQAALAVLYDATSAMVYSLALRILRQPDAAEEVVLDVYMQVLQQAVHYDAQRGTPLAWLLTLTRSRAIDRQRRVRARRQREAPLELGAHVPVTSMDPETCTVAVDLHRLVQQALARLTPEQRQVIETAYYAGLSHTEIAAQLGQPLGTVKTRLRTGMLALRRLLTTHMEDVRDVPAHARPSHSLPQPLSA
ncbi:MAG: sigma-70 family RNA polymerase sigma factor [Candidatus Tectimicrobiota bacterium]